MSKRKILLQLDTDRFPSSFDSVVAIDAGVEHLLTFSEVTSENVTSIVHGAMFTRSPDDLKHTAIFLGGSQVDAVEKISQKVRDCFFGPIRVSFMADPNGSNTTAAAAVLAAMKNIELKEKRIAILGGSGPVGRRIGQLIGYQLSGEQQTAELLIGSRQLQRAAKVCQELQEKYGQIDYHPFEVDGVSQAWEAVADCDVIFAAGAAGAALLPENWLNQATATKVAIDLNAVPPLGLPGIKSSDKGEQRNGVLCYGALGVGGTKMKIHKACLETLFAANESQLMTEEIYQLGKML